VRASDPELAEIRASVDCRTVLEQAGWELDARESTRRAAKYRNGAGRIVIVTQEGKGWFDPLSEGRGDVLALARHVLGLNLGHARKALRLLAGLAPKLVPARASTPTEPLNAEAKWRAAPVPCPGSPAWTYLSKVRALPAPTLERAVSAGLLREGVKGTVWALHQSAEARVTGWEMRGPSYKGFSSGGTKSLFWFGYPAKAECVAVTESAIDALSLATLEGWQERTVYASVGGGFGKTTMEALEALLQPGAALIAATDQGAGGDALAARLRRFSDELGHPFGRLQPDAKDWNEQLAHSNQDA
jgi:hypothetical protein